MRHDDDSPSFGSVADARTLDGTYEAGRDFEPVPPKLIVGEGPAARTTRARDARGAGAMRAHYRWLLIEAGSHRFLEPVFASLDLRSLRVFVESSAAAQGFSRSGADGLILALGECRGRTVAIAWSDFRVNAGCYGQANSRRFSAFLHRIRLECDEAPPLLYLVSSAGLSLMQGRALFSDAFQLWPDLLAYAQEHLVLTCAVGKCLGLGAVLYGLGHYRMAVAGRTHLNLTGPEVIKLFFGERVDYARQAAAEASHERNDLVHEIVPSLEAAFERCRTLLAPESRHTGSLALDTSAATAQREPAEALLGSFLDGPPHQLVPGWCPSLRLFIGTRRGRPLGIFINPPRQSNNLITVRTLDKYAAGLDLFDAMRLPIVSFLDSPGVDPRFEQSDANNIRKMLWVGEKIIHYRHGSMGVITGRCFGGASTLVIPKIFGGQRSVALRGSTVGVMQGSIIDQLLRQSPRLLAQWRRTAATQSSGLEDLLASGTLDAVIEPDELPREIDRFLSRLEAPARRRQPRQPARRRAAAAAGGHRARGRAGLSLVPKCAP